MKLTELFENKPTTTVIMESGSMAGVGAIHISEIEPTLKQLEKDTGLKLIGNTLGSVGKKEFSGDIDIAVNITRDQIPELLKKLQQSPIISDSKAHGLIVMSSADIIGYRDDLESPRERTGKVQVDFMLSDDPDWLKTYYHAPHENDSKYKGALRNIAVSALCNFLDRDESDEKTQDGRPLWTEKYYFSPSKGLIKSKRALKARKDGKGYTKSFDEEITGGPWKRGPEIAKVLGLDSADDLYSFETVFKAVEKNHGPEITKKLAHYMNDSRDVQSLGVPQELKAYL